MLSSLIKVLQMCCAKLESTVLLRMYSGRLLKHTDNGSEKFSCHDQKVVHKRVLLRRALVGRNDTESNLDNTGIILL